MINHQTTYKILIYNSNKKKIFFKKLLNQIRIPKFFLNQLKIYTYLIIDLTL